MLSIPIPTKKSKTTTHKIDQDTKRDHAKHKHYISSLDTLSILESSRSLSHSDVALHLKEAAQPSKYDLFKSKHYNNRGINVKVPTPELVPEILIDVDVDSSKQKKSNEIDSVLDDIFVEEVNNSKDSPINQLNLMNNTETLDPNARALKESSENAFRNSRESIDREFGNVSRSNNKLPKSNGTPTRESYITTRQSSREVEAEKEEDRNLSAYFSSNEQVDSDHLNDVNEDAYHFESPTNKRVIELLSDNELEMPKKRRKSSNVKAPVLTPENDRKRRTSSRISQS